MSKAKKNTDMPTVLSALVARTQFGQIMRRAKKNNDRFLVSKKGEPQVVILGVEDYFNNIVKKPDSLKRMQAEAKKKGLDKLSMAEIDEIVMDVRKDLWGEKSKYARYKCCRVGTVEEV